LFPRKYSQQAAALITALLMVAIVAVIAAAMFARENFLVTRTITLQNDQRMQAAAQVSIIWAKQLMQQPEKIKISPVQMPAAHFHGIVIQAELEDAQSRFNINNLSDYAAQPALAQLMEIVQPQIGSSKAEQLVKNIAAFISFHASQSDNIYYKQVPPYQVSHEAMVSVSELRLVDGVNADLYNSLEKYITALPGNTPINVNTASAQVLASLAPNMSLAVGKSIVSQRVYQPFASLDEFKNLGILKAYKISLPLTVVSDYFLLKTTLSIGKQQLSLITLLQHKDKHDSVVLWQLRV
jgi:general secretion pathway protein K